MLYSDQKNQQCDWFGFFVEWHIKLYGLFNAKTILLMLQSNTVATMPLGVSIVWLKNMEGYVLSQDPKSIKKLYLLHSNVILKIKNNLGFQKLINK